MHGERYSYNSDTPPVNSRGVLATARAADHPTFLSCVAPVVADKLQ